jgi:general secretion pathway protein D
MPVPVSNHFQPNQSQPAMIKPPLAHSIATLLGVAIATQPLLIPVAHGQSVSAAAQREVARRGDYVRRGEQALAAGKQAMRENNYEEAVAQYKLACDLIPNASNSQGLYADALHGFCKASVRFAEQRIAEGRYADAENQLRLVLDERYNPRCRDAMGVLRRLETPGYYNKTIGPQFRGKVETVKQHHLDADGFYDTGRYDLAMKRYDQVLNEDKYNIAARQGQEKVNAARTQYAEAGYNEARSRMLWQVTSAWQSPVRKFSASAETFIYQNDQDAAGTARIQAKLQSIIIPRLEFREATVREALDFLRRKSAELDTAEPDPARRGVSFVLKLDAAGGGAPPPSAAPQPSLPAIPGLEPIPGGAPEAAPAPAPGPAFGGGISSADTRITVALQNIPLIEALKYVTSLANLKYKVEPYAVAIVPQGVDTSVLIQKEYKVPPGFIQRIATGGADANALVAAPPADASRGGTALGGRLDAVEFLKSSGVTFPEGATAFYIASSSRLIVRNTQENLDLIDTLVEAVTRDVPVQVEIEAKFVEITQNNLKELSFDWLLGPFNVPGYSPNNFISGGTPGTSPQVNPADFPFVFPDGTPVGQNPVTAGNRSGSLGISQNAIDALLFGTQGASAVAPGILALSGVFTDPTYQVVIRALNQQKGVDLLSSPRVTAKSGQRAVIEIIREFRYPTEFDPPQIPQTFGNTGGGVTVIDPTSPLSGQQQQSFPVTPTTPTSFETRNTGVTLEVEPTVGPDGYTIELNLVPQVVEFEGFVNYGSPIQTTSTDILGRQFVNIITPNVINQPIFSTRKVTTAVTVFDGQTVVLGGLMREDVQKVQDKVPLLGDVPIVGRLFRSNIDQHIKRNLIIFVSARLMNPAGEPVRLDEEEEEEVVPSALPEATSPLPELPLFSK